MVASPQRPKGAFAAPFGLGMLAVVMVPSGIGPQGNLAISAAREAARRGSANARPPRHCAPVRHSSRHVFHVALGPRGRAGISWLHVSPASDRAMATLPARSADKERLEAELDAATGLFRQPAINRRPAGRAHRRARRLTSLILPL